MTTERGFITHLKQDHPGLWHVIAKAEREGLIVIDEQTDALAATNRLLLTYPALHEILGLLVNKWAEHEVGTTGQFSALLKERR